MGELDNINENILRVLQYDGRISNTDLAYEVGLSPSACLRRIQDLERRGIIKGYRAILDRPFMGAGIIVFVMVGLSAAMKSEANEFERAMASLPQVRECHNISGLTEYMLRVEAADLSAYKAFQSDILGALPQVGTITSHICLETSKDERG